jgi:hypothetical protein
MLASVPGFKREAVQQQLALIRSLVKVVPDASKFDSNAWQPALVAAAKAAEASRVVTDHPDLLQVGNADGIDFIASEAWLLEVTTPPPLPGT